MTLSKKLQNKIIYLIIKGQKRKRKKEKNFIKMFTTK